MTKVPHIMNSALSDTKFLDRLAFHLRRFAGQHLEVSELSEKDQEEEREKARKFIVVNFPKPAKQWTGVSAQKRTGAEMENLESTTKATPTTESNQSPKGR
jgi:hypothetical protein